MKLNSIAALGRYDCLFVSPHPGDVELSCVGRLLWERQRGQRVLRLAVFGGGTEASPASGDEEDVLHLDLPNAPRRQPAYDSFAAVLRGPVTEDDGYRAQLLETLEQVVLQTQARHVYLPLGVGGHVDHRLVHDAGASAVPDAPGREIFFYEDRPYSFLPGAVWIRLGQLGARLPPAAQLSLNCGLTQYLVRFQLSPYVRAHAATVGDRLRSNGAALQQWMSARGWHPRLAHGLRLQPIEHPLDTVALERARAWLHQLALGQPLCTAPPRTRTSRRPVPVPRLKRREETERYWLRLPDLERDLAVPSPVLAETEMATPTTAPRD